MSLPAAVRLQMDFDQERLLHDLEIAKSQFRSAPQAGAYHDGSWTGISLKAINGDYKNTLAMSFTNVEYTEVLDHCAYFKEILESLPFPVGVTRILFLPPGKKIGQHTDKGFSWEKGLVRLHIPIVTSPLVRFQIGSESVHWPAGQFWFGDFNQPHWLHNESDIVRVHIVMDCFVTEELLSLFPKEALEQIRAETTIKTFDHWQTGATIAEPAKYTGFFRAPKTMSALPLYGSFTATDTTLDMTIFGLPFNYRFKPNGEHCFQGLSGDVHFDFAGEAPAFTLALSDVKKEHKGTLLKSLPFPAKVYALVQKVLLKGGVSTIFGVLKLIQFSKRARKTV